MALLIVGLTACEDELPTAVDNDPEASSVAVTAKTSNSTSDPDGSPEYQEDKKALIGKFTTPALPGYPNGVQYIYEVSFDQLRLRNGNSHKVWFIPQSSKPLIVYAKDLALNTGITNSAPNSNPRCGFQAPGSDSFTDGDLPLSCTWRIGNGPNRITGTFEMRLKRGGPGVKAVNNTNEPENPGLDDAEITLDGKTFQGMFTHNSSDYTVSVIADRVKFRNGSSHREFVIPESHKLDDDDFSDGGPGWRVDCPFESPGADAVDGKGSIECTWKAGYGSAASGTVVLN